TVVPVEATALALVAAGGGADGVTGVALAADADAEVSPPADGDGDCEQATNPAPASSAQPARTDLRIVDDMLRPSCRSVDGSPIPGFHPTNHCGKSHRP